MIQHRVELADLHAHLFRVTLTIDKPVLREAISLPVWIPGSYLVREFSGRVQELTAKQGNKKVFVQQISKNTWSIANDADKRLTISYVVYAWDSSVRTAYLDATRGFFNGTSMFMRVVAREHEPQQVVIELPPEAAKWRLATGLPALKINKAGWGIYQASGYDELADSPFELGEFWEGTFTARGINHRFVVSGAASTFDGKRLLADTQKIALTELAFWHGKHGKPPKALQGKGYVFMLRVVDNGYGGLEHMNSTALIAKRSDLPRQGEGSTPEGYTTLLGLISHEYFHTWNVKRLRPEGFVKYDYDRENHTELLWFFEGFTSYYDDLLLRRAGLIDDAQYLALLAKTINQVQQTPGRLVHSLASSSYEAWTKYYRMDENSVNSTVSYYTKGSLVALCLDLMLREQGASLDSVMQLLWQKHCEVNNYDVWGINEEHIMQAIEEVLMTCGAKNSAKPIQQALQAWVHATSELPLSQLLSAIGVETIAVKAPLAQQLGLRVGSDGSSIKIKQVLSNTSAAKAGFASGDEWLAIEVGQGANVQTWRISSLDDLALYTSIGKKTAKPINAWVARDKQMLKLRLPLPKGEMTQADIRLKIVDTQKLSSWLQA